MGGGGGGGGLGGGGVCSGLWANQDGGTTTAGPVWPSVPVATLSTTPAMPACCRSQSSQLRILLTAELS